MTSHSTRVSGWIVSLLFVGCGMSQGTLERSGDELSQDDPHCVELQTNPPQIHCDGVLGDDDSSTDDGTSNVSTGTVDPDEPVTSDDGGPVSTSPDAGSGLGGGSTPECAAGYDPSQTSIEPPPFACEAVAKGLCFRSAAEACACAACAGGEECLVLESYPNQVSCRSADAPGPTPL